MTNNYIFDSKEQNSLIVGDFMEGIDAIICDTSFFLQYPMDFIKYLSSKESLYSTLSVKREVELIAQDESHKKSDQGKKILPVFDSIFEGKVIDVETCISKDKTLIKEMLELVSLEKHTTHNLVNSFFLDGFGDMYFELMNMRFKLLRMDYSDHDVETTINRLFFVDKDHLETVHSMGVWNEYVGSKKWFLDITSKINSFDEILYEKIIKINPLFDFSSFKRERIPVNLNSIANLYLSELIKNVAQGTHVHDARKKFVYQSNNKNSELIVYANSLLQKLNNNNNCKIGIYSQNHRLVELNLLKKYS